MKDWPGLGESAAKYLADKKVASVGTDALALDPFGSEKVSESSSASGEWDSNFREPDKSEKDTGIFLCDRAGK